MKTKLLLLSFFITLLGYSQAAIEQLQSAPNSQYTVVTGTIDQSPTGANASWDFTSLTNTAVVLTDTYTSTPPDSTIEIANGATTISSIGLNTDINGQLSVTSALASGIQLNYSDFAIIGTFPLSFGYTNTDGVEGTFTGITSGDVLNTSIVNVDVDAWGNLKVGSFDGEVTRLKIEQNLNLSTLGGLVTGIATQTSCFYYDANSNDLVFRTTQLEVPLASIDDVVMETLSSYTLDNNEYEVTELDIRLMNNPVKDVLKFDVNNALKINEVTIYDISGRIVLKDYSNTSSVHVNQLKSGLFLVSVETDKGILTKKFIKL
tara:strand:+ start:1548 stop:2504 length:957 start_codon:yes stop_codon:yes gene_type:complete